MHLKEEIAVLLCDSYVLCEQIRTIYKSCLRKYIGNLALYTHRKIAELTVLVVNSASTCLAYRIYSKYVLNSKKHKRVLSPLFYPTINMSTYFQNIRSPFIRDLLIIYRAKCRMPLLGVLHSWDRGLKRSAQLDKSTIHRRVMIMIRLFEECLRVSLYSWMDTPNLDN